MDDTGIPRCASIAGLPRIQSTVYLCIVSRPARDWIKKERSCPMPNQSLSEVSLSPYVVNCFLAEGKIYHISLFCVHFFVNIWLIWFKRNNSMDDRGIPRCGSNADLPRIQSTVYLCIISRPARDWMKKERPCPMPNRSHSSHGGNKITKIPWL